MFVIIYYLYDPDRQGFPYKLIRQIIYVNFVRKLFGIEFYKSGARVVRWQIDVIG